MITASCIRVSDVIQAVLVSRRLLERRFRALRGRGIGEEIRQVRVERAKNLLQNAGLPIASVRGIQDSRMQATLSSRFVEQQA